MARTCVLLTSLGALLLCLGTAPPARATSLGGNNLSLLVIEKKSVGGEEAVIAPVADYITLNVNDVAQGWVSFHASAYHRVQLNGVVGEDVTRFELAYGYLDLHTVRQRLDFRIGRQFVFMGVAREHADSVKLDLKGPGGTKLSLFGGVPVVSELDSLRGDVTLGGRLSWRYAPERRTLAEIGVSGLHSTQNHDPDRDEVGIDIFAAAPTGRWFHLSGRVFYDVLYDEVYDVAVVPVLSVGDTTLTFRYNRTEPSAYLSKYSVLSVFSDDVVEELGGTVDMELARDIAVDLGYGNFGYSTGRDAHKAEGNIRLYHGEDLGNLVGLGLAWTEAEEASFVGVRAFGRQYVHEEVVFVDGEVWGYFFGEEVDGEDASVSGSLDAGVELIRNLEVLAGFAYEQNPLLDEELRGTLRLTYSYIGTIGR